MDDIEWERVRAERLRWLVVPEEAFGRAEAMGEEVLREFLVRWGRVVLDPKEGDHGVE
jgi:hypothetical protein